MSENISANVSKSDHYVSTYGVLSEKTERPWLTFRFAAPVHGAISAGRSSPCECRPHNVSLLSGIQFSRSTHENVTRSIRTPHPGYGAGRVACHGPGSSGQSHLQAAQRMEEGLKDSAGRLEQGR